MTDVTIVFLVKGPNQVGKANIHYHDIGDYLKKYDKLNKLNAFKNIGTVPFVDIKPDEHGDWLNQRKEIPNNFIPLIPKKKFNQNAQSFCSIYSMGIQPNRDEWVYNFSEHSLKSNVNNAIDFFNGEVDRYNQRTNKKVSAKNFVNKNPRKFRWDRKSINNVTKNRKFIFDEGGVRITHYRPFCKQALYLTRIIHTSLRLDILV